MSSPRIVSSQCPHTTPPAAARLLALRFVIESFEREKGARPGAPDDAERRFNEIRAKGSIP